MALLANAHNSAAAIAWRSFISNPRSFGCEKLARSLVGAGYASMTKQRALNALFAGACAGRVRRAQDSAAFNPLSRRAKPGASEVSTDAGQIATVL
jgi:hypothetical protein